MLEFPELGAFEGLAFLGFLVSFFAPLSLDIMLASFFNFLHSCSNLIIPQVYHIYEKVGSRRSGLLSCQEINRKTLLIFNHVHDNLELDRNIKGY